MSINLSSVQLTTNGSFVVAFFPDELVLISALDQDAADQTPGARTSDLSTRMSHTEAANVVTESEKSQAADIQTGSDRNKILSRKNSNSKTTHKKKGASKRAPKRPLVCVPCKKHFTRRRKLDQHNRVVHDTEVTYSCNECHKTFSRSDNIARHMKHGKCPAHSDQPATDAELSIVSDDTELLDDLSKFTVKTTAFLCTAIIKWY